MEKFEILESLVELKKISMNKGIGEICISSQQEYISFELTKLIINIAIDIQNEENRELQSRYAEDEQELRDGK
jgi:hypothetical protein